MSLKINNETITISDLTGGNSALRYFNSDLTQLVPNKTGYKLFGSSLQRQQLKRMVDSTLPYSINYTQKFSNIVNCGDNTELFSGEVVIPFTFSFDINSTAFTQGTKYLLEHPNLIKVKTENNALYFNFPWKNSVWYYLPENILVEGANSISLTSDGSTIKLIVNSHNFTLVDSDLPLITTGILGYREDLVF